MNTAYQGPEDRRHQATLGLGSNLGNRLSNLQGAVDALGETPGIEIVALSPVYETAPLDDMDQPDYLNAVIVVETALSPHALLERAFAIEEALGRERTQRWASRTLDVDILTYDDQTSDDPDLTLPHPGAYQRSCDLAPWNDIDPSARVPGHGAVGELLSSVGREGVTRRNDLSLYAPG